MLKENKAIKKDIEWLKNNSYIKEIISISELKELEKPEEMVISEFQGQYPVDVKFTATVYVEVKYIHEQFGEKTDVIVGGYDAIRYKRCNNGMVDGKYGCDITDIEFVGEYSEIQIVR